MANLVNGVISITIGVIMIGYVYVPIVANSSTNGFTAGELAVWSTLSLAGITAVVYGVFATFDLA